MSKLRLPAALQNRNFSLYWFGWAVSLLGDQICYLALPWLMLQRTGSVIATGTILTSAAAPRAALMMVGGAISDRFSPRRVMISTSLARCLLIGGMAALVWTNAVSVWAFCVLAFAYGIADAGALPAAETYLPNIVPGEQLPAANSVLTGTAQLAAVVAPLPTGLLISKVGLAWPFLLDAISFIFLAAAVSLLPEMHIQDTNVQREPLWRGIVEGGAYIWQNVPLRCMMLIAAMLNFSLAGPIGVGLPEFVRRMLLSPSAFGTGMACMAGGGLLGTVLAGIKKTSAPGELICGACVVVGAMLMVIASSRSLVMLCVALVLMGISGGVVNVHLVSWVQYFTAAEVRGRVMGVLMLFVVGTVPLSFELAGLFIAWSFRGTFLLAGILMILISAWAWSQKQVRQLG